jgi:hypothetical protein
VKLIFSAFSAVKSFYAEAAENPQRAQSREGTVRITEKIDPAKRAA